SRKHGCDAGSHGSRWETAVSNLTGPHRGRHSSTIGPSQGRQPVQKASVLHGALFLPVQEWSQPRGARQVPARGQQRRFVRSDFEFGPGARGSSTYSMILKRFSDSSLTVKPSPGTLSSRSMWPLSGTGSPSKIYQKSSLPTSTSTLGKNSAIGEFR